MSEGAAVQTPTESAVSVADDAGILGDAVETTDKGVLDSDDAGETKDDEAKDAETDDTKKEDDKPEGAPEKYEFELPEGVEVDQAAMDVFEPILKELDLPNDKAQKLAEGIVKMQEVQQEGITKFYADQKAEALKIPADEIGLAKQALGLFPEEAAAIKADVYMRDNPAVIRLLSKFGGLAAEAKFREGTAGTKAAPLTFEEKADNMFKE
jgi:hypothetical protein